MALRSDFSRATCPIRRSLDVVGDPWILLLVRECLQGRTRFEEFRDRLGVADSVLSRRLATMVAAGLLTRVEYAGDGRASHVYHLTPAGEDLLPVLQMLSVWSEKHLAIPETSGHMGLVHETCGAETTSAETCTACGGVLSPDQLSWDKSWLGVRTPLVSRVVGSTA